MDWQLSAQDILPDIFSYLLLHRISLCSFPALGRFPSQPLVKYQTWEVWVWILLLTLMASMEHGQGTGGTLIKDEGTQVSGRIQSTTLGQLLLFRDHLVLQFGFFCSPIKTNPHYSGLFVPSSVIIILSTFHIPTRQINIPWEGRRRVIEQSGMKDAETETQREFK